MSLTKRVSIQWSDQKPSENTDTLVLTSPGKHYVDIRLRKNSTQEIEWAFCGQTKTSGQTTVYTHDIDSKGQSCEDSGHFEQLSSGDLKETGSMFNSATQRVEPYIEVWRRTDPESSELVPRGNKVLSNVVFQVLEKKKGQDLVGKIVRVGKWIQGVEKDGSNFKFFRGCYEDGHEAATILASYGLFNEQLFNIMVHPPMTTLTGSWVVQQSSAQQG